MHRQQAFRPVRDCTPLPLQLNSLLTLAFIAIISANSLGSEPKKNSNQEDYVEVVTYRAEVLGPDGKTPSIILGEGDYDYASGLLTKWNDEHKGDVRLTNLRKITKRVRIQKPITYDPKNDIPNATTKTPDIKFVDVNNKKSPVGKWLSKHNQNARFEFSEEGVVMIQGQDQGGPVDLRGTWRMLTDSSVFFELGSVRFSGQISAGAITGVMYDTSPQEGKRGKVPFELNRLAKGTNDAEPIDPIVGEWVHEHGSSYTFLEDGTYTFVNDTYREKRRWTRNGNTIQIGKSASGSSMSATISGNKMQVYYDSKYLGDYRKK